MCRGQSVSLDRIFVKERAGRTIDLAGARGDLEDASETADAIAKSGMAALLRQCQTEAPRIIAERWAERAMPPAGFEPALPP
jgi:hypothetical protein